MLTVTNRSSRRFCDRVSRRDAFRIGALGAGGVTLADLLRSDARAGTAAKRRSIINVVLCGGLSHIDSFDMKPEAPVEVRGTFKPISTNVPGIQICEHMPRLARTIDKLAILRSVTGFYNEHAPYQMDSGWPGPSLKVLGGRPGLGAVVSKVHGPAADCPITSVSFGNFLGVPLTSPGFLGQSFRAFEPFPSWPGRKPGEDLLDNLRLHVDANRFRERQELLRTFDTFRRDADRSGAMAATDTFTKQAADLILSGSVIEAVDISKESPETREAYGIANDNDPNRVFLYARRLIEAGVRVVTVAQPDGWDTHGDNFNTLKRQLPRLDVSLSGLLGDLHDRGLLEDTIVVVSTEFGRSPRLENGAGRSHWPPVGTWLVAGGGFRTGQVIGSSSRLGEQPEDRPVHLQQVFATLYRQLGIDVNSVQFTDPTGRPQYILDRREIIHELV